jgi:hypothetical protein
MHKTSSNTKIAFTVEKIIIKGFEVPSDKPIPRMEKFICLITTNLVYTMQS